MVSCFCISLFHPPLPAFSVSISICLYRRVPTPVSPQQSFLLLARSRTDLDATREEECNPDDFDVLGNALEERFDRLLSTSSDDAGAFCRVGRVPVVYLREQEDPRGRGAGPALSIVARLAHLREDLIKRLAQRRHCVDVPYAAATVGVSVSGLCRT